MFCGGGNTEPTGYAASARAGYRHCGRANRPEEDSVSQSLARFLIGTLLSLVVGIILLAPVDAQNGQATHQKLTFDGDTALWTMAIKPEKTADFEQIMGKLRAALMKSSDPARRQQAAGWKVMRMTQPLGDGTIAYVHIVQPVVKGADYGIMQTLYDAFPDERQALYEQYRGAFAKNVALATGTMAIDLSREQ
jgi:hypothetical protein